MHIDSTNYSEAKVGVATSGTPCGPYTYRGSFRPLGNLSRDLGLFQDTDGTAYLLSEDRNNGLRIDKLSADYLSVDSAVAVLGSSGSVEAPAMVKVNGTYYNIYATATSLGGPWSSFRDLAAPGTHTHGSQTADDWAYQRARRS
ncbi:family 43 glycosylhydrolase [Streptomyces sp. NPDC003996]